MVGKSCEPGGKHMWREAMIEREGQKQGQFHGESVKQEENGESVDFI